MSKPYPLHEDFQKVPVMNLPFNRLVMGLINALLAFDRFRNRSLAEGISKQSLQLNNPDGSRFKATLYTPDNLPQPAPALIYYHGGAFAMSYASMHMQFCQRYALEAGCVVLLVDYRLAPAKPFPAGFDDCYTSLDWLRERAGELGIDPDRIAVGGDSAGGAFAAGVAQKALDNGTPTCGQLLVYPVLDSRADSESATNFVDVPLWNANSNRKMWTMYLKNVDAANPPPYAAPGERANLSGLSQAYVETAEFDPLRDEGQAYAARLAAQGVEVEENFTRGTIHGYEMAATNPVTIDSLQRRIAFLQRCFAR